MTNKNKREPEVWIAYCHKDNCTTMEVIMYEPTKKMVTRRQDGQQYTKSLLAFTKIVAKWDRE